MQIISEFENIQIAMGNRGNDFPHVDATFNKVTGVFSIESSKFMDVLDGDIDDFPMREERLINAWIRIHQKELMENWQLLLKDKNANLEPIAPLK